MVGGFASVTGPPASFLRGSGCAGAGEDKELSVPRDHHPAAPDVKVLDVAEQHVQHLRDAAADSGRAGCSRRYGHLGAAGTARQPDKLLLPRPAGIGPAARRVGALLLPIPPGSRSDLLDDLQLRGRGSPSRARPASSGIPQLSRIEAEPQQVVVLACQAAGQDAGRFEVPAPVPWQYRGSGRSREVARQARCGTALARPEPTSRLGAAPWNSSA